MKRCERPQEALREHLRSNHSGHIQRRSWPHATAFFKPCVRTCVLGHTEGPPTHLTSSVGDLDSISWLHLIGRSTPVHCPLQGFKPDQRCSSLDKLLSYYRNSSGQFSCRICLHLNPTMVGLKVFQMPLICITTRT